MPMPSERALKGSSRQCILLMSESGVLCKPAVSLRSIEVGFGRTPELVEVMSNLAVSVPIPKNELESSHKPAFLDDSGAMLLQKFPKG